MRDDRDFFEADMARLSGEVPSPQRAPMPLRVLLLLALFALAGSACLVGPLLKSLGVFG